MSGIDNSFEEYQREIYQVEHSVKMDFESGFRALKYQLIPAIMESTFSDEEKTRLIEKYTHSLLNRTHRDWMR